MRTAVMMVAALLVGCGGGDIQFDDPAPVRDPGDSQGPAAGGVSGSLFAPPTFDEVSWSPCSLYEGDNDGLAECASTPMPLDWSDPDGASIVVAAKRLLGSGDATVQLWLLMGGPGGSGTIGFPARMDQLHERYPHVDVYTLDHRGTGHTSRLACPEQEAPTSVGGRAIVDAEMPACLAHLDLKWGADLAHISTTASTRDLAAYIEATRERGVRVVVSGGSYGSYWGHRYLQVAPEQADGVIISGIFPADGTFIRFDEHTNRTARDYFGVCGDDAFCSARLGPDPWLRLRDLLDALDQGHCSGLGVTRTLAGQMIRDILYFPPMNSIAPAFIYRLERCSQGDAQAIVNLFEFFYDDDGVWDFEGFSNLLGDHIALSEMWDHPDFEGVDLADYFATIADTILVGTGSGPRRMALREFWPVYNDTRYDDQWAETDTPLLMLQGALDPATGIHAAERTHARFTGEHQHWVPFPHGSHSLNGGTPLGNGEHCAENLFIAFATDPTAPLDTSCVDDVLPLRFEGWEALSMAVFDTPDLWENETSSSP